MKNENLFKGPCNQGRSSFYPRSFGLNLVWKQRDLAAENLQTAPTLLFSTQVKVQASILSTRVSFSEHDTEQHLAASKEDKGGRFPSRQYSGSRTRYEMNEFSPQNRTRRSASPISRELDRRAIDGECSVSPYSAERLRRSSTEKSLNPIILAPTLSSDGCKKK